MQISTSPKPKSFRRRVAAASVVSGLGAIGAAVALSVSPARAADFASQPDTQIAVFMIPVTLLIGLMLFEVCRFAWRNRIPASTEPTRKRRMVWPSQTQR